MDAITLIDKWTRTDVKLRLSDHIRTIWYLKNWNFFTLRDPDKHLLRKNNSYAFNYDLFISLPEDTKVIVKEKWSSPNVVYITTVGDVLKHNDYKYFKSQGFELQLFFPRESLKIDLFSSYK